MALSDTAPIEKFGLLTMTISVVVIIEASGTMSFGLENPLVILVFGCRRISL